MAFEDETLGERFIEMFRQVCRSVPGTFTHLAPLSALLIPLILYGLDFLPGDEVN